MMNGCFFLSNLICFCHKRIRNDIHSQKNKINKSSTQYIFVIPRQYYSL
jgi:hypothetical protein